MLLRGRRSIREVVLFPAMREAVSAARGTGTTGVPGAIGRLGVR